MMNSSTTLLTMLLLAPRYEALKSKLLMDRVGPDGLVRSEERHVKKEDIVDWPLKERDDYVFTPPNTVVKAFHLRAVALMAELARGVKRDADAKEYAAREQTTRTGFQEKVFDVNRGLYRDGADTDHTSLHANLFPLAFGLVPESHRDHVAQWLVQRGMKCSVYAAQYLLEGLFANGQVTAAIDLMLAPGDRSWRHMVESGTTITWEAWDQKYKPNQDWNHAWGAAPANLLPRFIFGAKPLVPGWSRASICPSPGDWKFANGKVSTPRGPILIDWRRGDTFRLLLQLPKGVAARVELPSVTGATQVLADGKSVRAKLEAGRWILDAVISGQVTLEVK